ncbi:conjugal transfer protein [Streptomyces sp. H27-H5]|uniref:conjugal transfer protein n=1 Tax=Streptomyces sp. H27-H5 TaxID=2996460 RepID=UPI00226FB27D|nr:conjugal transfer protein [Streptomyces sp. H27-H5]MCY0961748.1 conjugal transfer protein [Streptomyces sp. H27-H5]
MGETDSMTDHNSSAGGVDGAQPSGQRGHFGPVGPAGAQHPPQAQGHQAPPQQGQQGQQGQQAPQSPQQAPAAYGYPDNTHASQQQSSDAARAQVAAAWVRTVRPGNVPPGEAAVPVLPPRADQPAGESKKDRRKAEQDAKKAVRKAAYEQKKAEREGRKQGRGSTTAPSEPARSASTSSASGAPATTASATSRSEAPARTAADAGFDVPRPGGRLPAQGRRTHVAVRAALLITTCAFALGSCGVAGLVIGKSSVAVQSADLNDKEVARYRLTEFPTQAAATFAEEYVTLCMTYSPQNADKRRDALTRYTSSGVDRDCGITGQGTQSVRQAKWDGTIEELPEYGANGRYLGIQVKLSTGRVTSLSVPVYVKDPATGSGLRIAGDVGEMPLASRGSVPVVKQDDETVDQTLSDQLKAQVLPGFFKAWAASDATGLTRFTTTDASQSATTGLAGALVSSEVQEVVALAPAGTEPNATIAYGPGQTVQARVTVTWGGVTAASKGTPAPTTTVKRSYRLTMVNTAQGWFIKDIRGGVLDPTGGSADAGATAPPAASEPEENPPAGGDGGAPTAPTAPAPSASGAPKKP